LLGLEDDPVGHQQGKERHSGIRQQQNPQQGKHNVHGNSYKETRREKGFHKKVYSRESG
jgi:hypothetical protein